MWPLPSVQDDVSTLLKHPLTTHLPRDPPIFISPHLRRIFGRMWSVGHADLEAWRGRDKSHISWRVKHITLGNTCIAPRTYSEMLKVRLQARKIQKELRMSHSTGFENGDAFWGALALNDER